MVSSDAVPRSAVNLEVVGFIGTNPPAGVAQECLIYSEGHEIANIVPKAYQNISNCKDFVTSDRGQRMRCKHRRIRRGGLASNLHPPVERKVEPANRLCQRGWFIWSILLPGFGFG